MSALSSQELASMADSLLDLMPDTCDLLTSSFAADGQGGGTMTWATASSNVPCRLDHVTGNERVAGGALRSFEADVMTLPHNTVITSAYRILYGGVTYSIQSVTPARSWAACVRAKVERV